VIDIDIDDNKRSILPLISIDSDARERISIEAVISNREID
jgi:hypothetical protein